MFIGTGAFQVQPTYSFMPADIPQSTTKSKAKTLKAKTKRKELGASATPAASTIAPENDEDPNDEDPVVIKVR